MREIRKVTCVVTAGLMLAAAGQRAAADSRLLPIPAYNAVNMRSGTRINQFDLSLFIRNLTDSAPSLDLSAGTYYDPQDWTNVTLRPRTYGATLTWRN